MSDRKKIVFIVVLAFSYHVSCFASTDTASPTSHHASPSSHLSSPSSHLSSLISPISLTNHAGHVVSGEFGGVTNNTFIVNGKAYPLSVLPKSEIFRVKKLAGLDVRTAKEKRLDHAREMKLARIQVREDEGEIDKKTADRLRQEATSTVPPRSDIEISDKR